MAVSRYQEFEITIFDNHIYGFRFEWRIKPLTQSTRKFCGNNEYVWDPTSSRTIRGKYGARSWARDEIEGIRRPKFNIHCLKGP